MSRGRQPVTVDTLIIHTPQLESLADFYRQAFNLPSPQESHDHLGFQIGTVYLGFDRSPAQAGGQAGAISIWFRVPDLEARYDRLLALGARSKYPPTEKPWGDRLAAVYDPDGNLVGLAEVR